MRVVSPMLKRVVYPGLSRYGCLRRFGRPAPAVVTYHGIVPRGYQASDTALDGHLVSARAFTQQLRLLQKHYNVVTPEEFLQWREGGLELPRRSVLLTCDDGLLNTVTDMLPIIGEFGMRFLFFVTGASAEDAPSMLWHEQLHLWLRRAKPAVLSDLHEFARITGTAGTQEIWIALVRMFSALAWPARRDALDELRTRIGISSDWESEYSANEPLRRRFFMLNSCQLKNLHKAGAAIGAHTLSHPMLSQMNEQLALEEMVQSRARLETVLGEPVWALAYPFGNLDAVSEREPALAAQAGFSCAFMNVEDVPGGRSFAFPRIHVSRDMGLAEFDAHVSGFHHSLRRLAGAAHSA